MNRLAELRGGIINKSTPIQSVSAGARVHCGEINSFVGPSGFIITVLTSATGAFVTNYRPVEFMSGQYCDMIQGHDSLNICLMNSNVSRGLDM